MGCAFGALFVTIAIASSALVAMFGRTPRRWLVALAACVLTVVFVAVFFTVIRRVALHFREQDRLRRQLMADVAHELRTPLAILQGRIEGLLDGVYPRDDAHLSELLAETQHLGRLVDDVRTLANAEAGALDLRKEKIDLAEVIRDTAKPFAATLDIEELPAIEVDPVRIREVLLNLLTNAADHARANITIHAQATPRAITIRVRDDGPGIPAGELPHLFDRFRKGPHSRGSGLGLSIARKLVLAHGGTIDVESAEDAGTTVTVSLPR